MDLVARHRAHGNLRRTMSRPVTDGVQVELSSRTGVTSCTTRCHVVWGNAKSLLGKIELHQFATATSKYACNLSLSLRLKLLNLFNPSLRQDAEILLRLLRCLSHSRLDERTQSAQQRKKSPAKCGRLLPTDWTRESAICHRLYHIIIRGCWPTHACVWWNDATWFWRRYARSSPRFPWHASLPTTRRVPWRSWWHGTT